MTRCGGYDYQFVHGEPQEFLICKICLAASRDPYLSVCCGHIFCKSCIDKTKQKKGVKVCPVCRSLEFAAVFNKQVDRLVKSLYVFCTNKKKGCRWQGELYDIDNHLRSGDGCQFEDVLCTNECGKVLKRFNLPYHLDSHCPNRKISCKYCYAKIEQKFIDGKHKDVCPKFPLSCPNKCKVESILRENLQKHLNDECILQNVECSNKCGLVLQRQYLSFHLKFKCLFRLVKCQYCQHQHIPFMDDIHKSMCPKRPVCRINKCGATIRKKNVNDHKKSRPLEKVPYTFHGLRCDDINHKDQTMHNKETVEKQLQLVLSELSNTKQKLAATDQMLSVANSKLADIEVVLYYNTIN